MMTRRSILVMTYARFSKVMPNLTMRTREHDRGVVISEDIGSYKREVR